MLKLFVIGAVVATYLTRVVLRLLGLRHLSGSEIVLWVEFENGKRGAPSRISDGWVKAHLDRCERCCRRVDSQARIGKGIRAAADAAPEYKMSLEGVERLDRAIQEEVRKQKEVG